MSLPPDTLSYSDLGGTKIEYSAPVDTSTDRSAAEVNLAFAATAEMTRTSLRTWFKFRVNGSGAPTLVSWDASWKGGTVTPPTFALIATGKYTVTLPATVLDEQGVSHSINLQAVTASICKSTDAVIGATYLLEPMILTANTIRLWVSTGAAAVTPLNSVITMFVV